MESENNNKEQKNSKIIPFSRNEIEEEEKFEHVSDYLEQLPRLKMMFKKTENSDISEIKFPDIKYIDELTLKNGKKIWTYEIIDYKKPETEYGKVDEKKYKIVTFINNPSLLKEYIIYKKLKNYSADKLYSIFTIWLGFFGTIFYSLIGMMCEPLNLAITPLFLKFYFVPLLSGISLDIIIAVQHNIKFRKFIKICSNKEIELSKLLEINDVSTLTNEQILEKINGIEYQNTIEYKINEKARKEKEITDTKQNIVDCTLKQIEFQEKLKILQQKEKSSQRIIVPEECFFYTVENNKKIREEFLENNRLKYIDLILFKFDNADIHGVDFRDTNAIINPQTIYNKDISGCNFDGIDLGILTDFNGVNITGTSFNKMNGIGTLLPPNIDEIAYKENINQSGRNK